MDEMSRLSSANPSAAKSVACSFDIAGTSWKNMAHGYSFFPAMQERLPSKEAGRT